MALDVLFERPGRSSDLGSLTHVVIVRSLKQTASPNHANEQSWATVLASEHTAIKKISVYIPIHNTPLGNFTATGINDNAHGLLTSLRGQVTGPARVVLLGYTFGGLIIKHVSCLFSFSNLLNTVNVKALLIAHDGPRDIASFSAVASVIFVGTIQNAQDVNFDKSFAKCAASELGCGNKANILRCLRSLEYVTEMRRLCDGFNDLSLPCCFTSFCEKKRAVYGRKRWINKTKAAILVPENLGSMRLRNREQIINLDEDHSQLSSYLCNPSPLQKEVSKVIGDVEDGPYIQESLPEVTSHVIDLISRRSTPSLRGKAQSSHFSSIGVQLAIAATIPCHVIHPYQKNPNFCGREDILERLRRKLSPQPNSPRSQAQLALIGIGGMGKTQTALAYALSSIGTFPVILWAQAESRAKLAQSYSEFDNELGLSATMASNQTESRERVKRWLKTTDIHWLLVLDNMTLESANHLINDFWPSSDRGSILITTREESALGNFSGTIEMLEKLPISDATDLLMRVSKRTDNDFHRTYAEMICKQLDCYPLAIVSAAILIRNSKKTLEEYLQDYSVEDLIRTSNPITAPEARYPHTLFTVWDQTFARLDPDARHFLGVLVFLDADGIDEQLLLEGIQRCGLPSLQYAADPKRFRHLLENLCSNKILDRNPDIRKLWMHRVTQSSYSVRLDSPAAQCAFDSAFRTILSVWPVPERHNRHQPKLYITQKELINHVASLSRHYKMLREAELNSTSPTPTHLKVEVKFAQLLYNAAWYLYERGDFQSASPLLSTAEDYCLDNLEGSEYVLADIYGAYGASYSESNDRDLCLENFEKQLSYTTRAIEKGQICRPDVREAMAYGNMANAFMGKKRYEEAEEFYEICLELWKYCPGDAAIYIPHYAVCLALQNDTTKLSKSERVLNECIRDREKEFGPRDRKTFRTGIIYLALGNTQIRQNRLDEAYQTHLFSLEMLEETLGKNHHRFADACYKVGWHLYRRGNFEQSEERLQQALDIYTRQEIYKNEAARAYFKLSQVVRHRNNAARNLNIANEFMVNAENLYETITGNCRREHSTEEDYDELIMFWSR
ncbi:hypothetical protein K449DRAFT_469394 [Hypoxylon sp. EC38]|nr:hypothetical protein K449DRAFT_469394 [Hypoxylon sp. EC38]